MKQGDIVFDTEGRRAVYVARCEAGHVVEIFSIADADEEPYSCGVETWPKVFESPPTQIKHAEIAKLNAEIAAKRYDLSSLRAEIEASARAHSDLRAKIKSTPSLADLDLWLAGKVTHLALLDYGCPKVGTVDEILTKRDDYGRASIRLLNLRVDPGANEFWIGVAQYSDGSSANYRCRLATSLEEANRIAAEDCKREYSKNGSVQSLRYARSFGATLTAEESAKIVESDASDRAGKIARLKREFELAKSALAALEAHPDA